MEIKICLVENCGKEAYFQRRFCSSCINKKKRHQLDFPPAPKRSATEKAALAKLWKVNNPDKVLAQKKRYYEKKKLERPTAEKIPRTKIQAQAKAKRPRPKNYRKKITKEQRFQYNRIRRAFKAAVETEYYTRQMIIDAYGSNCHICGTAIDLTVSGRAGRRPGWQMGLHIDHVVSLYSGGSDTMPNLRPSHAICNLRKGKMPTPS